MSSPVTRSSDTTIADALALMNKKNVRRLPVVDENGRMMVHILDGDVQEHPYSVTPGAPSF